MKSKTIRYKLKQCEDKKLMSGVEKAKNRLREKAVIALSIILLMFALTGYSQTRSLSYQILRNGNKVGTLHFSETGSGETDSLKVESNVKTKLVSNFIGYARESAVFTNGIMVQ